MVSCGCLAFTNGVSYILDLTIEDFDINGDAMADIRMPNNDLLIKNHDAMDASPTIFRSLTDAFKHGELNVSRRVLTSYRVLNYLLNLVKL